MLDEYILSLSPNSELSLINYINKAEKQLHRRFLVVIPLSRYREGRHVDDNIITTEYKFYLLLMCSQKTSLKSEGSQIIRKSLGSFMSSLIQIRNDVIAPSLRIVFSRTFISYFNLVTYDC